MVMGLSRTGAGEAVATSTKLGEFNGLDRAEVFVESSCSPGLASASFHSPDSVSRVTFHELVATGKSAVIARAFSTLKKSLFNHWSGFGSMFESVSATRAAFL